MRSRFVKPESISGYVAVTQRENDTTTQSSSRQSPPANPSNATNEFEESVEDSDDDSPGAPPYEEAESDDEGEVHHMN